SLGWFRSSGLLRCSKLRPLRNRDPRAARCSHVRTGGRSATATPVLDRAGTSQWALPAWPRGRAAGEQAGRSRGWNDDGLWVSMAGATPSVEGGALVSDASESGRDDGRVPAPRPLPAPADWAPPSWDEVVREHSGRVFRL